MILNLLILTLIIIFITDISGVVEHIKSFIIKYILKRPNIPTDALHIQLLECSLCQTWWIGLFTILITGNFTIQYIGYVAALSFLTKTFYEILILIQDVISSIIKKIYKIL